MIETHNHIPCGESEDDENCLHPAGEQVTFVFRDSSAMRELMNEVRREMEESETLHPISIRCIPNSWTNDFIRENPSAVAEMIGSLSGTIVVDRTLEDFVKTVPNLRVIQAYDHWSTAEPTFEPLNSQVSAMLDISARFKADGKVPIFLANGLGDHVALQVMKDMERKEFALCLKSEGLSQEDVLQKACGTGLDFGPEAATALKVMDLRSLPLILKSALIASKLADNGEHVIKARELEGARELWRSLDDEIRARGENFTSQIEDYVDSLPGVTKSDVVILLDHHIENFGVMEQLSRHGVDSFRTCCCCAGSMSRAARKVAELIRG